MDDVIPKKSIVRLAMFWAESEKILFGGSFHSGYWLKKTVAEQTIIRIPDPY